MAVLMGVLVALLWGFLGLGHPSQAAAVGVANLTAKTRTPYSTLNLRSCASTSCTVLRSVPHGTLLTLTAASGDWFKTSYRGATGWVHSRYTVLQGTPSKTLRRGNTSRKMVAYTFDAGSDLGNTGKILDFLKNRNIKAGFGLTGTWAAAHPTYVKRIFGEGHLIFDHTWDHKSFTGFSTGKAALTPARRTEELIRANNKIRGLTGHTTRPYFRPPYGDYNSGVLRDAGANRFSRTTLWTLDSWGWKGLTAAQICDRVVDSMSAASNGGNGYILLFHVGSQSRDANALPCITDTLKKRGFKFGTIPQVTAP
ncbi:peptidoglycan/xylan/chitin deacetylase (PgdA/CDA1 family) [Microlunatus panaciterrae]|uniref:Peptidoglycan/xylan/chitin deacetylase (PgdA/CDA1 family) n=1 Tax=Microlunatus panaciterrae TaxID=400768 RepID=A0ABS2RNC7_9ACTN|nr:polysaccharide deacetylase family protein [Microlunatus panaciterrae]MBM7800518.1 peptidoglycan/xylan/chitin deacetylase (PgdA/CDA1 family) [Microlunatus panaciterrae]